MNSSDHDLVSRVEKLNAIGIALSSEKDMPRLLEMILTEAKIITGADGGTLYTVNDQNQLVFEIVQTDSLKIGMGGTSGIPVTFKPIPLHKRDGSPNIQRIVAYSALNSKTINLSDVYQTVEFDFSGPRQFDKLMNYRTKSMLTIPMNNHEGETVGVLQLINKLAPNCKEPVSFSKQDQHLAESLASQAAIALTNKHLIDGLKNLFDSFIKTIATGIDAKSPYTGGHCKRVPVLTLALADAASKTKEGSLKDFHLSNRERYALEVASWLHDCGKLVTPIHIVDKATKLETIYDRINLIDTRFEVLKRDAEIKKLKRLLADSSHSAGAEVIEQEFQNEIRQLNEDRKLIRKCNKGSEYMVPELQERVKQIGSRRWRNEQSETVPFFTEDELRNLLIPSGTLTPEERDIINDHIVVTIKMLKSLEFPKEMENVLEYAGGHHERMDGKGFPLGLKHEQISVPARIMAIADVFEALTARDRPYKEAKKLSEALSILGAMKQNKHIDPDLFDVFIHEKIYLSYAREYLDPDKIDIDDPSEIPGFPFD
jgi:HD-GYP domain-containing protein (c-di-GMP phosphodiesterase class II)